MRRYLHLPILFTLQMQAKNLRVILDNFSGASVARTHTCAESSKVAEERIFTPPSFTDMAARSSTATASVKQSREQFDVIVKATLQTLQASTSPITTPS